MFYFLFLQPIRSSYQQSALYVFLVVLAGVQTFFLFFVADAQRYDGVDHLEDHKGDGI